MASLVEDESSNPHLPVPHSGALFLSNAMDIEDLQCDNLIQSLNILLTSSLLGLMPIGTNFEQGTLTITLPKARQVPKKDEHST